MKEFNFSNKDIGYIESVYQTVVENYYERNSVERQMEIISLNNLIMQSISHKNQIKVDPIITKLQFLKVKARSHPELKESIDRAILHLKNPTDGGLHQNTLQQCLKSNNLFQISCMIIERKYQMKLAKNIQKLDINKIFKLIYLGAKQHIPIAVDALLKILNNYTEITGQSGIIEMGKKILTTYFPLTIKDKNNVTQSLKLIMEAIKIDKSLIHNHEQIIGLVLYTHPSCILQIQWIVNISYNEEYCQKILNESVDPSSINLFFVWTNSSAFCSKITPTLIQSIENLLNKQKQNENKVSAELQYKIYKILTNIVSVNGSQINQTWTLPQNIHEKVINSYLLLIKTILYNSQKLSQKFNLAQVQKMCNENKLNAEVTKNLLADIKKMMLENNSSYMNKTSILQKKSTIISQNLMDLLLSKAAKIPKNDKDIQDLDYVLSFQLKSQDKGQISNLKFLKIRAISSLKQALENKQCPTLQKIYNSLNMKQYDSQTLKQLLQIIDIQLKNNPSYSNVVNLHHLAELILQVFDQKPQLLNFQKISQIIYLCCGSQNFSRQKNGQKNQKEWKKTIVDMLSQLKNKPLHQKTSNSFQDIGKLLINRQLLQKKQSNSEGLGQRQQSQQIKQQKQQKQVQIKNDQINTEQIQNQQIKNEQIKNEQMQKPTQIIQNKINNQNEPKDLFPNKIVKMIIKQKLKKWKKLTDNSKHRFFKIRQWSQTEKSYLQKLLVLRDQVRKPLLQNNLMTQLDSITVFSNLDAMIKLSQLINVELETIFSNWHPIKTELSSVLNPLINCLKIYKEYSERYNKSYAFMSEVAKKPNYKTCVKISNMQNYLFSPVQRFQKYHLFVSQYLRKLPKYHKDSGTLTKALNSLLKATDEINQFIENQARTNKMIELQNKFGNIVSHSRVYKTEFSAVCYDCNCKVYLFNNLLLIVRTIGQKQELSYKIQLCLYSFVVKQPDCKSFKNRLYVCGYEKSVHLNFLSTNECDKAYDIINDSIQKMYQNQSKRQDLIMQSKSRLVSTVSSVSTKISRLKSLEKDNKKSVYHPLQLSAQVVCMQKLVLGQQLKVLYVIKITATKPYENCQYLFYEYGKLESLQNYLLQLYPNIKTPTFEVREKQIDSNDVVKIGEHLCIAIQKFLNFIIRNQELSKKPQLILHRLGLHQSMWQFAHANRSGFTCLCFACQHAEICTDFNYYYKQRDLIKSKKYRFCVLNSFLTVNTVAQLVTKNKFKQLNIEEMMIWAKCKQRRIDYRLLQENHFGKPLNLKINVRMLSDTTIIKTKKATIYSTARQIIQQVCSYVGIQTTSDLALVFVYGKYQSILDDDQYLYDIGKFFNQVEELEENTMRNSTTDRYSFWERISFTNPISPTKVKKIKVELNIRKIYVFSPSMEQLACHNNHQRYLLIVGELLYRYKNRLLILNGEEIKTMCALLYCVENFSTLLVEQNKKIEVEKLKKYLPESRWDLMNAQFLNRVQTLIRNQLQTSDKPSLVYKNILKIFGSRTNWQCQYFEIESKQKSTLIGDHKHLLIGVSYKKVILTRQHALNPILTYPITTFKYRIYADNLYIDTDEKTCQFTCENIFTLDTMIKTYRLIKDFTD